MQNKQFQTSALRSKGPFSQGPSFSNTSDSDALSEEANEAWLVAFTTRHVCAAETVLTVVCFTGSSCNSLEWGNLVVLRTQTASSSRGHDCNLLEHAREGLD